MFLFLCEYPPTWKEHIPSPRNEASGFQGGQEAPGLPALRMLRRVTKTARPTADLSARKGVHGHALRGRPLGKAGFGLKEIDAPLI